MEHIPRIHTKWHSAHTHIRTHSHHTHSQCHTMSHRIMCTRCSICSSSFQARLGPRPLSPTMAYHHANRSGASRGASLARAPVLAVDDSRALKHNVEVGWGGGVSTRVCFETACRSSLAAYFPSSHAVGLSWEHLQSIFWKFALHAQKHRSCFNVPYSLTGSTRNQSIKYFATGLLQGWALNSTRSLHSH